MRTRGTLILLCAQLVLSLLPARIASAAWPSDPALNLEVSRVSGSEQCTAVTSDGFGGMIVAWCDQRTYNGWLRDGDIYAQRVSSGGEPAWTANGVAVCANTYSQAWPTMIPDGAGGAIVVWQDLRKSDGDVYAQRISHNGVVLWGTDGVGICTNDKVQYYLAMVSDGAGGAIVAWRNDENGAADIYAQRVSADGLIQWSGDGVAVSAATGNQVDPVMVSDGAGGAIVAWTDSRGGGSNVYAQRISATGQGEWAANGVPVCTAALNQLSPTIVSDGAGGAIVAWMDGRSGTTSELYAQRLSAAGVAQWATNGVVVCAGSGSKYYPRAVSDDAGGAVVAWRDNRSGTYLPYAQKVSASGAVQWTADGVALSASAAAIDSVHSELYPMPVVRDGQGGAIVTWPTSGTKGTCAQRISAAGALLWGVNGTMVSVAGVQHEHASLADGTGGAVIAWVDDRNVDWDIYAQAVRPDGQLGSVLGVDSTVHSTGFRLEPIPNPATELRVGYALCGTEPAALELIDLAGRRLERQEVGALGKGPHTATLGAGLGLSPGIYFVQLTQGPRVRRSKVILLR